MPMVLPASQIQQGPQWANMQANQAGFQSLLAGLQSIQDAQRQRAEQEQMGQLAQILQEPDPMKRQAGLTQLMAPQQANQSVLGKIFNPVNPMGQYQGTTGIQSGIANSMLGNALRDPEEAKWTKIRNDWYSRNMSNNQKSEPDYLTEEEKVKAARIKAGLEPRATAPKVEKTKEKADDTDKKINALQTRRDKFVIEQGKAQAYEGSEETIKFYQKQIDEIDNQISALRNPPDKTGMDYRPGSMNPVPNQVVKPTPAPKLGTYGPNSYSDAGAKPSTNQLTDEIAIQILNEAGGDPNKAREIARQRGYSF